MTNLREGQIDTSKTVIGTITTDSGSVKQYTEKITIRGEVAYVTNEVFKVRGSYVEYLTILNWFVVSEQ